MNIKYISRLSWIKSLKIWHSYISCCSARHVLRKRARLWVNVKSFASVYFIFSELIFSVEVDLSKVCAMLCVMTPWTLIVIP